MDDYGLRADSGAVGAVGTGHTVFWTKPVERHLKKWVVEAGVMMVPAGAVV